MSSAFLNNIIHRKSFYKRFNIALHRSIIENAIAVSRVNKYIYCRIYKAANSTVVSSLYNAETSKKITTVQDIQKIKDNYFVKPSQLKVPELNDLDSFMKFTFVRNPYSRIWSAYLDKLAAKDRSQRKIVLKSLDKDPEETITFDEFLYFLENGGLRVNGHWAPQNEFLVFPLANYDIIGKVESLDIDLSMILRKIYGKECEIVNVNDHKTSADRISMSMSLDDRKRVYKLYESDFDCFHYESEFPKLK